MKKECNCNWCKILGKQITFTTPDEVEAYEREGDDTGAYVYIAMVVVTVIQFVALLF